jgi:Chaperone of endosialidase
VAQLGAGLVGTGAASFPTVIDSRQVYVNVPSPAPDSNSRVDAEVLNDTLATLVAIETSLGANFMGQFGSLAARLNAYLPGSGGQPGIVTFTNALTVAIPGTTHNIGQAALVWQLYDAAIPANAMDPGTVMVQIDPPTYDVLLSFAAPTSGAIAIGAPPPLYIASFTTTSTVSVPGTTHQLGTSDLQFKVYLAGSPYYTATEPGSLTIHPTTHDVLMTFGSNQSGILVLSAGGPAYATSFTLTSSPYTVIIPGATHLLGTHAILPQVYDAATPRAAMGLPTLSVHPTTFDVHLTFGAPISGRVALAAASTLTGRDFDIRDAGIVNQSAVRMHSYIGDLYLQAGSGQHLYLQDRIGSTRVTVDTLNTRLGIGTATPTQTLELASGNAIKPGGGSWLAPSDIRQKDDVRPFADGLDVVLALEPILYRYNGLGGVPRSPEEHIGLIAQAVQGVAPYMVRSRRGRLRPDEPETDLLSLDTSALPYVLVNALKALHTWLVDVTQLQQQQQVTLATFEARLQHLEAGTPP